MRWNLHLKKKKKKAMSNKPVTGSKNVELVDFTCGALWRLKTDSPIFYLVSCLSDFFLFLLAFRWL